MTTETVTLAKLEGQLLEAHKEIKSFVEKANGEIKEVGKVSSETKAAVEKHVEKINEIGDRIDKVEAKLDRGAFGAQGAKSLGEKFVESEQYKSLAGQSRGIAQLRVTGAEYKTIVNATGQNQPLVPADRVPGIIVEPNRRLRIRDLPSSGRTNSNLIEYTKENVFTNSAAPQTGNSPTEYENVTKAESNITFTLDTCPVTTLAHFIDASKQVLADAPMLQSYIDGRLRYGLKLKEDEQLLTGSGNSGNLRGLYTFRTAFSRANSGDTKIDTLKRAITQLQIANHQPDAIVLAPSDWEDIVLTKDTQARYVWSDPTNMNGERLWGLPVVITNSMTAGAFLVGAFKVAATIWDREDLSVSVSTEDGNNFKKNMVTILAEERLAQTIHQASGLVGGTF